MIRKTRKGFTIIEMVITIGIGSIFLFGTYILLIQSINSTKVAKERTTASHLATKKQEELRKTDYDAIANSSETATSLGVVYTIVVSVSEKTTALPPPTVDVSKRKDIKVTVTWTDQQTKTFVSDTTIIPPTIVVNPT